MLPCCDSLDSEETSASAGSVATSPKKMLAPDLMSRVAVAAPMPVAALERSLVDVMMSAMKWPYPVITTFLPFRPVNASLLGTN